MNGFTKYMLMTVTALACLACNDYFSDSGTAGGQSGSADAKANGWMHSVLSQWYLWNGEVGSIPSYASGSDYRTFLSDYLGGMKTNSDDGGYRNGKRYLYSTVERTASTRSTAEGEPTFGFGMIFTDADSHGTRLAGRVTYVHENSPAADAGIKRGMWFYKINGEDISYFNYTKIVTPEAGSSITLSQASVQYSGGAIDAAPTGRHFNLTAVSTHMSPILAYKVFETSGRKIGYLAYLQFERGYNGYNSTEYEQQLKEVFADFRSRGIDDLILDLRYNPGGYTVTCRLLASLIVRQDRLGTLYSQNEYNSSHGTQSETFDVSVSMYNIDMSRVYVLATERTASAAENIINSLRGADVQVIHIGTKTEGKNVGMTLFEKNGLNGYDYDFWPVTFKIYNAKGESDFGDGFTPDRLVDEWDISHIDDWKNLGDSEELLTKAAIGMICENEYSAATRASGITLRTGASTQDFRSAGGMRQILNK